MGFSSLIFGFLSLEIICFQRTLAFVVAPTRQRHSTTISLATSANDEEDDTTSAALDLLLDQFEDERNVPKLEEWAFHHGVDFAPGIRLIDNGMGDWGVGTAQSLDAQSPIVTIPSDLILSSKDESVQEYAEAIVHSMRSTDNTNMDHYAPECLLMVRILQELAATAESSSSPWKEWLQTLPPDFSTGLYLDPLERSVVERVAGPFLEQQEKQWRACQTAIETVLPNFVVVDDDDDNDRLKWAFSVVFTRSWRTAAGKEATLVPLGDMFNHHSAAANVAPNPQPDGSMQMLAKQNVEPESPLHLSYGLTDHPGRFLVTFGFWDRSSDYMDANLTNVPKELAAGTDLVVSTRTGHFTEDVFTVAVYQFLLQRDPEAAQKMIQDPSAYTLAYDLEGALWLRLHALKMISETYPEMDIAPENLSESPRRYGMIARYNNGMRESWLRVIDYLELEIEDAMKKRREEETVGE